MPNTPSVCIVARFSRSASLKPFAVEDGQRYEAAVGRNLEEGLVPESEWCAPPRTSRFCKLDHRAFVRASESETTHAVTFVAIAVGA